MDTLNNSWADLIMKYLRMNISAEELEELNRQRAASPLKQAQFEEFTDVALFWRELEAIQAGPFSGNRTNLTEK
jgi:hypothetical protein